MPLPRQEVDATTPKYLRDKYAIVGVGETTYTRGSGRTTRALGTWAVRNAMLDAGLKPSDIDGMLSYQGGDSTSGTFISGDLGMRLNFYMDVMGGGSSTEALVGIAIGLIEAGCCKVVAIFRSRTCSAAALFASRCISWIAASRPTTPPASSSPRPSAPAT